MFTVKPGEEAAALAWAVNKAAIPTSGVLYFPAEETATYDLAGWVIPDYISLKGEGRYSRIIGKPTFTSTHTSYTRAGATDLTFVDGIKMVNAREFLFLNCRFEDSVWFHPTLLNHYNTFLHCTWQSVIRAIDCEGRNHFNKLISCRINHDSQDPANPVVYIYPDGNGNPASAWNFIGTSIEGNWRLSGAFAPAYDIDGLGHYGAGLYLEAQNAAQSYDPAPIIIRGDGCDFHFVRISGIGAPQDLGNNNRIRGRIFQHSVGKYTHDENHGTIQLTPDVNGDAVIVHNVRGIPSYISVDVLGNAAIKSTVQGVDNRNITVRLVDIFGVAVTLGSHNVLWTAKV